MKSFQLLYENLIQAYFTVVIPSFQNLSWLKKDLQRPSSKRFSKYEAIVNTHNEIIQLYYTNRKKTHTETMMDPKTVKTDMSESLTLGRQTTDDENKPLPNLGRQITDDESKPLPNLGRQITDDESKPLPNLGRQITDDESKPLPNLGRQITDDESKPLPNLGRQITDDESKPLPNLGRQITDDESKPLPNLGRQITDDESKPLPNLGRQITDDEIDMKAMREIFPQKSGEKSIEGETAIKINGETTLGLNSLMTTGEVNIHTIKGISARKSDEESFTVNTEAMTGFTAFRRGLDEPLTNKIALETTASAEESPAEQKHKRRKLTTALRASSFIKSCKDTFSK